MNPNIEQPTQLQIIKAHLQKGLPITSWQAIQDWHITRLGAHICELKKTGHGYQKPTYQKSQRRYL